jgi:deoxyribonuclease IV
MIRIGFHLSIANGIGNAAIEAGMHEYGAFQIFVSNPRGWAHSELDREDVQLFQRNVKKFNTVPYVHVPYLCNPSSPNKEMNAKSIDMLLNNMKSCNTLGIKYLVIHMGSHTGKSEEGDFSILINTITYALDKEPNVNILLENSAGFKNSIGSKIEDIGEIIDAINSDRVGVCLDTCHAFAAGYDLHTKEGIEECATHFENSIGFKRLKLVHLNDAKYPCDSGLDRHYHIGKGYIGKDGFVEFFKNSYFNHGSFVMETPIDHHGNNKTNMNAINQIIKIAASS